MDSAAHERRCLLELSRLSLASRRPILWSCWLAALSTALAVFNGFGSIFFLLLSAVGFLRRRPRMSSVYVRLCMEAH